MSDDSVADWRHLSCEHLDASLIGWVRQCHSPLDRKGELLRVESIDGAESARSSSERCGQLDTAQVFDDDGAEKASADFAWRCTRCGGRDFRLRRIYLVSQLQPAWARTTAVSSAAD
jgi:hypothetical protein